MNISNSHLSKDYYEFVKSIGESRSKQDEDQLLLQELAALKLKFNAYPISQRRMKENVLRSIYCEMLGHDSSIFYIHAINLVHEKPISSKRLGYLACTLFLDPDHELMLLIINAIQKDLNSDNRLEISAALSCISAILNGEIIPMIYPSIKKLLNHSSSNVRKKACMVLRQIYLLRPSACDDVQELIMSVHCDTDPSVMGASLFLLHDIVKADQPFGERVIPSLVCILKQICERKLSRNYEYHRVSAPWMQVKILSILATIGSNNKANSEAIYSILLYITRIVDTSLSTNFAVIYEFVKTVTSIYPSDQLLEVAATCISRFISSSNNNLKYAGLTGLSAIVQVNAVYAAQHQLAVVDCLEDSDESLKRKTLELLCKITNSKNVVAVVDKLLSHLRASVDVQLRQELSSKLIELAERFSPENNWFVSTMNTVLELAGNLGKKEAAYNLMQLIAEGPTGDDEDDDEFRKYAVLSYIELAKRHKTLPDLLMKVIAWVIGEYGALVRSADYTLDDMLKLLCSCTEHQFDDPSCCGWFIMAIIKLCARSGKRIPDSVTSLLKTHSKSCDTDIQERCYEANCLLKNMSFLGNVIPYHASTEEIEVDENLGFLDNFVASTVPPDDKVSSPRRLQRKTASSSSTKKELFIAGLNFKPYGPPLPQPPHVNSSEGIPLDTRHNTKDAVATNEQIVQTKTPDEVDLTLLPVPRLWGPGGFKAVDKKPGSDPTTPLPQPNVDTGDMISSSSTSSLDQLSSSGSRSWTARMTISQSNSTTNAEVPKHALTEREKVAAAIFSGVVAADGNVTSKTISNKDKEDFIDMNEKKESIDFGKNKTEITLVEFEDSNEPDSGILNELLDVDIVNRTEKTQESDGFLNWFDDVNEAADAADKALLKPQLLSTEETGRRWSQLPFEKKKRVHTSAQFVNRFEFFRSLEKELNLRILEVVKDEAIFAATVIASNEDVFVHSRVSSGYALITVKAHSSFIADEVLQRLEKQITNYTY